ncbi:MAG: hypothetical protein ACFCUQ_15280 [Kiloniellales bacterium]
MARLDMTAGGETEEELYRLYLESAHKDVAALLELCHQVSADPSKWADSAERMREIVHNVKGQGASFGYPLMTRVGDSLTILLKQVHDADEAVLKLVAAHVETLRTVLDKDIKGNGGELGESLAYRLESLVDKLA